MHRHMLIHVCICLCCYISRTWAGSHELRVIKRDEIVSLSIPKLYSDHIYDHWKRIHLAHFELQIIYDYFCKKLTIFSLFDPFLANFLEIQDRRSIFQIFLHKNLRQSISIAVN